MKRSRLKYKAKKTKCPTDIRNYKNQRHDVVNLHKKTKLEYFSIYHSNCYKPFWIDCKPSFTNKHNKAHTNIILREIEESVLKNNKIANTVNNHSGSIVTNLGLDNWDDHFLSSPQVFDRTDNTITWYKNHPSIKNIKRKCCSVRNFPF